MDIRAVFVIPAWLSFFECPTKLF